VPDESSRIAAAIAGVERSRHVDISRKFLDQIGSQLSRCTRGLQSRKQDSCMRGLKPEGRVNRNKFLDPRCFVAITKVANQNRQHIEFTNGGLFSLPATVEQLDGPGASKSFPINGPPTDPNILKRNRGICQFPIFL